MNGAINEGYVALLISIFRKVTPEDAFRILEGKSGKNRKWTIEEIKEIDKFRKRGFSWYEIGNMYGVRWEAVAKRYNTLKRAGRI